MKKRNLIAVFFLGIFFDGCTTATNIPYIEKSILISDHSNQVYFDGNFNNFTNTISIKVDSNNTVQSALTQEIDKSGFDLTIFESKNCGIKMNNNIFFSINTKVITSTNSELYGILKSKDGNTLFYIKYDSKSGKGIALDNQERCFEINKIGD